MRLETRLWTVLGVAAAALLLTAEAALGCTTFLLDKGGSPVVGKSYDWGNDLGLVITNPRGLQKQALHLVPGARAHSWVAKFGSVTFNQYGREMPNGGMNEAGLVVEIMWLHESRYPAADSRPALNELQWIQHALDRYANVAELVAAAPGLRVQAAYAPVHDLACDKSGACAAFEYLAGRLRIHHGADLPAKALTNDTYARSTAHLGGFQGFGGAAEAPRGRGSLTRFVNAARSSKRDVATRANAFDTLRAVSQGDYSKWRIVYEPASGLVHFQTLRAPAVRGIDLRKIDLACSAGARFLDMNGTERGDITANLAPYSQEANRELVQASFGKLGGGFPAAATELLARFPSSLRCVATTTP